MIKVDKATLRGMEAQHPGIEEQVRRFEEAELPVCPHCTSEHTAEVNVGVIGRTIYIAGTTTKFRLIPNGPKPGTYFCNSCKSYFE